LIKLLPKKLKKKKAVKKGGILDPPWGAYRKRKKNRKMSKNKKFS